jgi:hypothetical protein
MHKPHDRGEKDVLLLREKRRSPKSLVKSRFDQRTW